MKEKQLTNRDHLDHLGCLAEKVRVIGKYILTMDADEMICGDQNDYHSMGEHIYSIAEEINETLEKIREIRRAA